MNLILYLPIILSFEFNLKVGTPLKVISNKLKGHNRNARDQLLRASQSILLNIAEGNGKTSEGDRRRFFEIARGSAFECAAIQDILQIGNAITAVENNHGKVLFHRIASMLTKLGNYSYKVKEDTAPYQIYTEKDDRNFDYDYDSDYDIDKIEDRF